MVLYQDIAMFTTVCSVQFAFIHCNCCKPVAIRACTRQCLPETALPVISYHECSWCVIKLYIF